MARERVAFFRQPKGFTKVLWLIDIIFFTWLISACSVDGSLEYLNSKSDQSYLQGHALMFQSSSQATSLSSDYLATCTDKKVSIHAVSSDGSIDTQSLAESSIDDDGVFQIPNASLYPLKDSVSYVLQASGCGQEFYRPVTDYTDQDISMGTTLLGFLPQVGESSKKPLNEISISKMKEILKKLVTINSNNLSQGFDSIAADSDTKSAFESLTGISMDSLKEIPPTVIALSTPKSIVEGQTNVLSVTAQHWYSDYRIAYQWIVDGVSLSNSSSVSWTVNKNSQGAHTVVLNLGASNGMGGVDLTKPTHQQNLGLVVENTYPATPPSIVVSSRVQSRYISVTINTGAAKLNCETFSYMALVEGFLPPEPSDFTRLCSTSGTQTETFTLSNSEGTKQIALWVKDAAGNISLTSSGQLVTLDTTPPSLALNALTGVQTAGSVVNVNWSAADTSGLALLKLQYAADGTNFSDVVDLLTTSGSPYAWTVPADNVSTAKLKLVATDNAGNWNSLATTAFSIDATVPGPPVATLSGAPSVTSGAFDININFTEAVTGLTSSSLTVTNGSASNLITTNGASYSITITPSVASGATGTTTVKLPAGSVIDYSSDPSAVDSNTLSVIVDKERPTVNLASSSSSPLNGSFSVTATFSENVTGFTSSGINTANATISNFSGSGSIYTFDVVPTIASGSSGTASVVVPVNAVFDQAQNQNYASNTLSRSVDKISPQVTLSSATSNPTNGTVSVTATFSESVTGFSSSDLNVTNGSVFNFSGSGSTYTFDVIPSITSGSSGTTTIQVNANGVVDAAQNANSASNTLTYSIDKVAPTVSLTSATSNPTNGSIAVTATFSESVTGFSSSGITVTNASVSNFSGSGSTYTFNLVPSFTSGQSGVVTAFIDVSVAQDGAGNTNSGSNMLTYSIDKAIPTVTLTSTSPNPTNGNLSITATFSEAVTGLSLSGITVSNATASSLSGSGTSYTFSVTPTVTSGTVNISLVSAAAQDAAGNSNSTSNTLSFAVDKINPTVTLTSSAPDPTNGVVQVTATFSESVTGLSASSFSTLNSAVSNLSGSGSSYTFDLIASSNGSISVSLPQGTVQDAASNTNAVSNTLSRTYNSSNPAVTLSSTSSDPINGTISVTATFSSSVTGMSSSGISITGGSITNFAGSGTTYTFDAVPTVTAGHSGSLAIQVLANQVQDAATNFNNASNTLSYTVDKIAPTVTLTSSTSSATNSTVSVTATFSESVTGFTSAGLSLTNCIVTSFSGSGTTYTMVLTPIIDGTVAVQVQAGAAQDAAGNSNGVSNSLSRTYDTIQPTVTLSSATSNPTNGTISVTATFSESVTGFSSSSLSVANAVVTNFSGSGTIYTFDVVPSAASGTTASVTIQVLANAGQDAASNLSLASNTLTYSIDKVVPTVTLSSSTQNPTNGTITVTATFSKSVTGFSSSSVSLTNANSSAVVGSGTTYSFNVAPTISAGNTGTVTIQVSANAGQDSAGNNSSASNTLTYSIDKVVPTVTLTSSSPDPTNTNVTVTATFSKSVTGLTTSSFSVTNGSVSSLSGSGTTYSMVVAHSIGSQTTGTLSIQVPASAATDNAGNANSASNTLTRSIDTQGPSVTLASSSSNPTYGSFTGTATLSLSSSDFSSSAMTVTGGSVTSFSGSGTSYSFTVTPNAQQASPGTITVSVAAGALHDSSLNNPNTVSNTLSRTVPYLTPSWSTSLTSSNSSLMPVSGGVASLSATNLSQSDFSSGTHLGTTYDASSLALTLNKTLPSAKELDSTWTPKWSNLIGYWKLNGTGAIANGATITATVGRDGTSVTAGSMSYVSSQVGTGISLDGTNDSISVADVGTEYEPSNITIMGWIKLNSYAASTASEYIASKPRATAGTDGNCYGLYIYDVTGRPTAYARTTALGTVTSAAATGISLGVWHHIAMTADGTNLNLYVDGALSKSTSFASSLECVSTSGALKIGSSATGTNLVNGKLDDVSIFNTALSTSEIQYIYAQQTPNSTQSELHSSWVPQWNHLVGYYNFNSTANDFSGNSRNLTENNGVTYTSVVPKLGYMSASLDGTDDYFSSPSSAFRSTGTVTAMAWIYPTSNSGSSKAVILREGATTDEQYSLYRVNSSGSLLLEYYCTDTSSFVTATSTATPLGLNQWHHVALIRDSSLNFSLLVDGAVVSSGQITCSIPTTATSFVIGSSSSSQFFTGYIDEVAVWDTNLAVSDVMKIFNKQNSKFAGLYTSPVTTSPASSNLRSSSWATSLPFLKSIPGDYDSDGTSDSETSSSYSGIAANLATGLVGLWRFDETTTGGVTGGKDFADSSGKGRNASVTGGVTLGNAAIFKNGLALNGTSGYVNTSNFDLGATDQLTFSIWAKNASNSVSTKQGLMYKTSSVFEVFVNTGGTLNAYLTNGSAWHNATTSAAFSDWGSWHLVTMVYNGTDVRLYRDGILIKTSGSETGNVPSSNNFLRFGFTSAGGTSYWNGNLDEAAVWNRALSAGEVLQLYRRGANRNKFQFRACSQSDCSDKTDADWLGPDKTTASWFSELHNMTSVASTGDGSGSVNLTSPLIDFNKWISAVSGWAWSPSTSQYFQYRALLESDDINNLCLDASSNAVPCLPDVKSITPLTELNPAPYITTATGVSFYTTLASISFTTSGNCASDSSYPVKYQLSKDGGSTYQYYNGTSWVSATAGSYSTASSSAQISSGLNSYTCSSAPCSLMIRAYPGTNTANSCNISAPVVSVNRF